MGEEERRREREGEREIVQLTERGVIGGVSISITDLTFMTILILQTWHGFLLFKFDSAMTFSLCHYNPENKPNYL